MVRQPVDSSNIRSVGWENGTLEVEFNSGRVYEYPGVTEAEYREFMGAPSKGAYFAANIRNRVNTRKA